MKNEKKHFIIAVVVLLILFSGGTLPADTVTQPADYVSGDLITAAGINERFTLLYNVVNGNIGSNNLVSDAASLFKVSGGVMTSSGGNIGIGTTTPGISVLYIKDTGQTTAVVIDQDGASDSYLAFADNGTNEWHIGRKDGANSLTITESLVSDRMTFLPGGNVGIGTTSPEKRLHVAGDVKITGYVTGDGVEETGDSTDAIKFGTRLPGYDVYINDDLYVIDGLSAQTIADRTAYPKDLETAYAAVLSMERLPDGEFDENDKEKQLDHSKLHAFIKTEDEEGRNLSATVSAQNEVIKDLLKRIEELEARIK